MCVSGDLSLSRLNTFRSNLRRLGKTIPLFAGDAARPPLRGGFDRVLLDLSCSGTGTLRKHPEIKWRLSEEELERMAVESRAMLEGAAPLVAPRGLLVAMTCSIEREENEEVIDDFLAHHADFAPLPLEDRLAPSLRESVARPGLWRLLPSSEHDGFTVSVLVRSAL